MFRKSQYDLKEIAHIEVDNCAFGSIDLIIKQINESTEKRVIYLEEAKPNSFYFELENGNKLLYALAEIIALSKTIESITINGKWFGVNGVIALCAALKENNTVHTLTLSGMSMQWKNKNGDTRTKALLDMFKKNRTITQLDLSNNNFSFESKNLAKIIESSSVLTSINYSQIELGWQGFDLIAAAIRKHPSLQYLDLRDPYKWQPSVENIIKTLAFNRVLLTLHLPKVSFAELKLINEILINNNKITTLTFVGPKIDLYDTFIRLKDIEYELSLFDIKQKLDRNFQFIEHESRFSPSPINQDTLPEEIQSDREENIFDSHLSQKEIQDKVIDVFNDLLNDIKNNEIESLPINILLMPYVTVEQIDVIFTALQTCTSIRTLVIGEYMHSYGSRVTFNEQNRKKGDFLLQCLSKLLPINNSIKFISIYNDWYTRLGFILLLESLNQPMNTKLAIKLVNCPYMDCDVLSKLRQKTCIKSIEIDGSQTKVSFNDMLDIISNSTITSFFLRNLEMDTEHDPQNEKIKRLLLVLAEAKNLNSIELDIFIPYELRPILYEIMKNNRNLQTLKHGDNIISASNLTYNSDSKSENYISCFVRKDKFHLSKNPLVLWNSERRCELEKRSIPMEKHEDSNLVFNNSGKNH